MMKKQMMIQALFAMMLGFAVPAVHAAADENDDLNKRIARFAEQMVGDFDPKAEAFQGLNDIVDENVVQGNKDRLAQAKLRVAAQIAIKELQDKNIKAEEFDFNGHEEAVKALEPVTQWQIEQKQVLQEAIVAQRGVLAEIEKVTALKDVNVAELDAEALAAYKVKVVEIKDGTDGKDALVQKIKAREDELAAAAAAAAEAVKVLNTVDAIKAFMSEKSNQTEALEKALDDHLKTLDKETIQDKVAGDFAAYKAAINSVPASAGMSRIKKAGYACGAVTIVALGYEVFGRVIPKFNQLKRRQKHDENLQGKNMFVEALREELKAAERGLKRGYEGLKGFFVDEDEDDQEEEAVEQA